jgi:hypothetical protein
MSSERRYQSLLGHIQHHNVRGWLKKALECGAHDEDARTIGEALLRMSEGQLQRRVARMLAKNEPD